jgi:hypothetical protein
MTVLDRTRSSAEGRDAGMRLAERLTVALLVVTFAASALTLLVPDVLSGVPAMNGSARGTALVLLLGAVPLIGISARRARDGSSVGYAAWTGGVAYTTYNGVMFCLATPHNELFLLYAGMLGLAFWTLMVLLWQARPVPYRKDRIRVVASYIWVVGALNALGWLSRILPATFSGEPAEHLEATGLPVNVVYVQDLAFWVPAMAVAGWLLWRAHPWGGFGAAAGLVFWQAEALGVAVDQWFGQRADPGNDVATLGGVWLFAGLFLVGVVPMGMMLRRLRS